MHQAVDAVCRDGQIVPLEAVDFRENERLLIVRLSNAPANDSDSVQAKDWSTFAGVLKESPNWADDPTQIQQAMRHEWD